jgi:hypothetical protein
MTTQELLIDEINWLKALIEKCEPGQMRMDMGERIKMLEEQLKTIKLTIKIKGLANVNSLN